MVQFVIVGVPFDGYGRSGHQASAAAVLRESGLAAAFSSRSLNVVADTDLDLPGGDPRRGADTSLINESALITLIRQLEARLAEVARADAFPVVLGGDCTTLLGIAPALGVRDGGLLFIDGHEDTMPLDVSEDGEAANAEIGLLLGLTGKLARGFLATRRGTLPSERLALLGQRDVEWRRQFNVGSLRDHGVWMRDHREVAADPAGSAAQAVGHLKQHATHWWLHVDLDVLDPLVFAAQGLPDVPDDPGGLSWDQLLAAIASAIAEGGCVGLSIAIYDPDQDAGRDDAKQIVDLIAATAAAVERSA